MNADIKRVHLLLGPETGEKAIRIREIRAALRRLYGSDPEIHRFYPFETPNGEIFAALDNNSLFADHRLVILSQADELTAGQVNELAGYIASPSRSATLLIVSNETSLPKKITSSLHKDQIEMFWEMFDNRKPDWVRSVFTSSGYGITGDAVDLLLELVENNTQELRITSFQLMQFVASEGNTTITEEDVERYIRHTRSETVFSLFEHMAAGTLEKTLGVLHALLGSGNGDAVSLLAGLLWQFRRLISIEEALERGLAWEDACIQAKVMGKPAQIRRKKDHGIYQAAKERYSLSQTRSIIARIGEFDMTTRELGPDMQRLLLEQMVMVIMVNRGAPFPALPGLSFSTDARF